MKNLTFHAFASANGSNGFRCYFGSVFDPSRFSRLYIIKGGPGTGKSRFMHDTAEAAEAHGKGVIYLHCSSDPVSLDGIITETADGRMAMLDGTAPHLRDTLLPGAADELINLGEFWNSTLLASRRGEIEELCQKKAECFDRTYAALTAAGACFEAAAGIAEGYILREKLEGFIQRMAAGIPDTDGHGDTLYFTDTAYSMNGEFSFPPLSLTARRRIVFCGDIFTGGLAVRLASGIFGREKREQYVTASPLCDSLFTGALLPETGFSVSAESSHPGDRAEEAKYINCARFADKAAAAELRPYCRDALRETDRMKNTALALLAEAKKYHFALEDIYSSAMDFSAKEKACAKFISRIDFGD